MLICICCPNGLTADTKPEHVLLNALGGRKTTQRVGSSACLMNWQSVDFLDGRLFRVLPTSAIIGEQSLFWIGGEE